MVNIPRGAEGVPVHAPHPVREVEGLAELDAEERGEEENYCGAGESRAVLPPPRKADARHSVPREEEKAGDEGVSSTGQFR